MADFIQGDYEYTIVSGTTNVKAVVVDKNKSSYENIPSTVVNEGITYNVTSLYKCFEGCINLTTPPVIPNSVTSMSRCFYGCTSLTTAPIIPNGVIYLENCFYNCTALTTAPIIPNSVISVYFCFQNCTSLTTAPVIPNGVTNMSGCFDNCTALTTAPEIPNSVTDMGNCFDHCISLTTAPVIPDGVIDMGACFYYCTSLTTPPVIPSSVTSLFRCFGDCTSLTTAPVIPNSVINIQHCFRGCTALTIAPDIPNSITNMSYCFYNCTHLSTPPEIPNSVTNMQYCFYGCTYLPYVKPIPASVTDMDYCFYGCTVLGDTITVFNNPTSYNNIFTNTSTRGIQIAVVGQNQSSVINTWTTIANQYDNVTMWSASDEIAYIGDYQYRVETNGMNVRVSWYSQQKTKLGEIITPLYINNVMYNITSMDNCFRDCAKLLVAPTIPNSITRMGYCFSGCRSLTKAPKIPEGVTILANCFERCTNLVIPPKIPEGVTILSNIFSGCTNLVIPPKIPEGVTRLNSSFAYCENLIKAPDIPSTVTEMEECFNYCTSLTTFPNTIPANVTRMGKCFGNCINLTGNIKISWNRYVDNGAFRNTVKPIYLINDGADVEDWRIQYDWYRSIGQDNIYLAEEIGNYNCVELTTSTAKLVPNDNTQCSYYDFTNYNSVAFWGETHNVVALSFEDCNNLMISPYISNFITNMDNCFSGCTNLRGVIKVANNPTSYTDIFADTVYPIRIIDYNSTPSTTWQTIASTYDNVTYSQLQTAYVDIKRLGNSVILSNLSETNDSQSTKTKVYVSGIDFTNIPDDWQSYIVEFAV